MYIDANTIITISAVLAALGGIGGVVVWCIKFVDRQKKQDKELAAIRKEQTLICYGVLAYRGCFHHITGKSPCQHTGTLAVHNCHIFSVFILDGGRSACCLKTFRRGHAACYYFHILPP